MSNNCRHIHLKKTRKKQGLTYRVYCVAKFLLCDWLVQFGLYETRSTTTLVTHVFRPHGDTLISQKTIQSRARAILVINYNTYMYILYIMGCIEHKLNAITHTVSVRKKKFSIKMGSNFQIQDLPG